MEDYDSDEGDYYQLATETQSVGSSSTANTRDDDDTHASRDSLSLGDKGENIPAPFSSNY